MSDRLQSQPVHRLADALAEHRLAAARHRRDALDAGARRKQLRRDWEMLLGDVSPSLALEDSVSRTVVDGIVIERIALGLEDGIVVPLVLLRDGETISERPPVVIAFARAGKAQLLSGRAQEIRDLLAGGVAVCLPDLQGTGEAGSGNYAGPRSVATVLSCRDQVLGQTRIGARLKDLRSVLVYLRNRTDLSRNLSLWGDSLAEVNPVDRSASFPHRVDNPNTYAEPTAGLIALLCGLFEDDVTAIATRGTFASFRSMLRSQFLYVPHDAAVAGVLEAADVADLAAALAPRPLLIADPIDGINRRVPAADVETFLKPTLAAYHHLGASEQLSLPAAQQDSPAAWLLESMQEYQGEN